MQFVLVAELFERLEKTSKRQEKVLFLRDFIKEEKKDAGLICDLIAGNYQRQIDKRQLGISVQTLLAALSLTTNKTLDELKKDFSKEGDIGKVAKKTFTTKRNKALFSKDLQLEDIIQSLWNISKKTGTNSNKFKQESIAKLLLSASTEVELKFISRLLIDDLRIGVSIGTLKEACVNALFPAILDVHLLCENCKYLNFNQKNCFRCKKDLDSKNQETIIKASSFVLVEMHAPKHTLGLNEFIPTRSEDEELRYLLRLQAKQHIIKSERARQIYNLFLSLFEQRYNTENSFADILNDLKEDLSQILKTKVRLFKPLLSMLAERANSLSEAFAVTGSPTLLDYKYDGLRVQIHNDKGKVMLFTRNLDNITKQFPEITTYIEKNFSDLSFILDSECVGYDFQSKKYLPFQTLSKRILAKNVQEVSKIKVIVRAFDILLLNEEQLLEEPYEKRRNLLEGLFLNRELKQELSNKKEELVNL
ncbi:hypothetical protein H6501_01060 [Candidatus Woesearchaeota archaeon]|nr:hypothetical protein [Nanoarchaeota archaeon]MCB9370165.1 hypothetical protein [Candidatus Woesearchaeota archaeon]USN44695.1 MAG: hypothetical protein H6500_02535 [Candidatus Woesearchaeota archaeon]